MGMPAVQPRIYKAKVKPALFKWQPLSQRQTFVMNWWTDASQWKDWEGIIADGSVRSGKTISMAFGYCLWAMNTFEDQNFGICGKTIGALKRNVVNNLKRQLKARGYVVVEKRADNLIEVTKGRKNNHFYMFSGKDEASQDIVQGITLAGAYFDEVALMPESFVNQVTARCSVTGSKWWFNCNPQGPEHWFYKKWICKCIKRKIVYLRFTMEDNLTLSENIRHRYEQQYVGVFYLRYIMGLWVMAEGIIYDMFNREQHVAESPPETEGKYYVSSDYGIQNATVFLLWQKEKNSKRWVCLREWKYSGREQNKQKTVKQLADGLVTMLDGIMPDKVILDPSATALKVELKQRGYSCKDADNDVVDGIADVQTMLAGCLLLFMDSCKGCITEFGQYSWDSKAADRGEDKPIKLNDHSMDAVRYFVKTMRLVKRTDRKPYRSALG